MALTLAGMIAGEGVAKAIQLAIEYDPLPPYDCGSVAKAGPEVVNVVRTVLAAGKDRHAATTSPAGGGKPNRQPSSRTERTKQN